MFHALVPGMNGSLRNNTCHTTSQPESGAANHTLSKNTARERQALSPSLLCVPYMEAPGVEGLAGVLRGAGSVVRTTVTAAVPEQTSGISSEIIAKKKKSRKIKMIL